MEDRKKISSYDLWIATKMLSPDHMIITEKDVEFTEENIKIDSNSSFNFYNCKFNNLLIRNCHNIKFYDKSEVENIKLAEGSVNLFQFFNSIVSNELKLITSSGEISLDNSTISNLYLQPNFGSYNSLQVNLCTFNKVTFHRFLPHAKESTKFELCIVTRQILFEYSILDNVAFNGLDLTRAEMTVLNSSLIKANYYSITWPLTFRITETVNGKRIDELPIGDVIKLRDYYRQLKTIAANLSNKVDGKKFLKNEIRCHHRIVILQRKGEKKFLAWLSLWVDSLMLRINQLFTDYGESLIRPVATLLITGFAFFLYWKNDLGLQFEFDPSRIEYNATLKAFGYYLNFLNPVHSSDIKNLNGCDISLYGISDFLMRLISGFLIYHIVRATRKFNFSV